MVGLLQIASLEQSTGQDAVYLLTHPALQQLLLDALIVYASMVPVMKGAKLEPFGVFSPRAELTNGRLAM